MTISVFAPASIGNLSVGFDVLGLAVKPVDGTLLGDVVAIEYHNPNPSHSPKPSHNPNPNPNPNPNLNPNLNPNPNPN